MLCCSHVYMSRSLLLGETGRVDMCFVNKSCEWCPLSESLQELRVLHNTTLADLHKLSLLTYSWNKLAAFH